MKTAYVISPGLQLPESFQWRTAPIIIAQPGLWDAMKTMPSGIVFRVRTDQNVGDRLNGEDRIESAVGLVDSTTRWRSCLAMIRIALSGLRIPEINECCWNIFGMMTTKHPANVAMTERTLLAQAIRNAMEKLPADDPRATFESSVAAMCVRLAYAENDVEVAHIVPYTTIYMVNGTQHPEDREATVEVLASSVFLAESFGRLLEKCPEYMFMALPKTPNAAPPKRAERVPPAPEIEKEAAKPERPPRPAGLPEPQPDDEDYEEN